MATCYRHPNRETGVSCSNCGRPICPDCMVALRAALAAQSTGLNLATVPIQPGARLSCISAPDRNVSGSSSALTALAAFFATRAFGVYQRSL